MSDADDVTQDIKNSDIDEITLFSYETSIERGLAAFVENASAEKLKKLLLITQEKKNNSDTETEAEEAISYPDNEDGKVLEAVGEKISTSVIKTKSEIETAFKLIISELLGKGDTNENHKVDLNRFLITLLTNTIPIVLAAILA